MPKPLEIKLRLDTGNIASRFMALADRVEKTNKRVERLRNLLTEATMAADKLAESLSKIGNFNMRTTAAAGGTGRAAAAGGVTPRAPRVPSLPRGAGSGPQGGLNAARAAYTADPSFDNAYRLRRAQEAYKRAQRVMDGPNPYDKLVTMIRSTRFGRGGLMPLVGRTWDVLKSLGGGQTISAAFGASGGLKGVAKGILSAFKQGGMGGVGSLLGSGSAMGTAGVAMIGGTVALIAAAVAGVTLLGMAANKAADRLNEFARGQLTTGGTVGQQSVLGRYGGAIGMSESQISGLADSLQNAVQSGFGMAYAQQGGFYNAPGQFGSANQAQFLIKAVEYLRSIDQNMGREEAIRRSRALGISAALPMLNVSNRQMAMARQDANIQAQVFTPQQQRNAADFSASLERMSTAFENLFQSVFQPMMPLFTGIANATATFINGLTQGVIFMKAIVSDIYRLSGLQSFIESVGSNAGSVFSGMQEMLKKVGEFAAGVLDMMGFTDTAKSIRDAIEGWSDKANNVNEALNRNSDALEALGVEIQNARQIFGGGDRSKGALPTNWRGQYLQEMSPGGRLPIENQTALYGAFAL